MKNRAIFLLIIFSIVTGCKNDLTSEIKRMEPGDKAEIIDSRDGKTYQVIKMKDGNLWMAENLDYNIDGSICIDCEKYGRMYRFDHLGSICPSGWKIPSLDEWWNMLELYEPDHDFYDDPDKITYSGKGNNPFLNGKNGFNLILGGRLFSNFIDDINNREIFGYYWTISEIGNKAYIIYASSIDERIKKDKIKKLDQLLSCRCMKVSQ